MPHATLEHPTRPNLPFHQGQNDERTTQAVASIANELGVERKSIVNTETREAQRQIRGRVTAPRRARESGSTDDWLQALATYADQLEAHVDEFQGDGYTLVDTELGINQPGILESIGWSRSQGQPYEFEYTATFRGGQGTFETRDIRPRNPTPNTGMSVPLRVDGVDLPGFRDYRTERSVGIQTNAVFDRDNADNNDIVFEEGTQQRFTFEGTHTGDSAARSNAYDALNDLVATREEITLETRFPGYSVDGFVNAFAPTQRAEFGGEMNHYRLEFIEGLRA